MINFLSNLQTEEHNFVEEFYSANHAVTREIPTSKSLSGIEVRLSNITIIDNKTPKVFPFPGLAKVYLITLAISDVEQGPISFDLHGFERVDDGDKLSVDRVLFSWKPKDENDDIPSQTHIFCSLIKCKQRLRNVAKIMQEAKDDEQFKNLTSKLSTLVKSASNLSAITSLTLELAGIVGKFLGTVDDKPLLTVFQSFTDLNGDYDRTGKNAKTFQNKYASLDLSITIRDKTREDQLKENNILTGEEV